MSGFSSMLQVTDLDDFIKPSLECIKPEMLKTSKSTTGAKVVVGDPNAAPVLKKVEITLQDCLACSGCVTSAESVLISQQSQEELLKVLNQNNSRKVQGSAEARVVVVTIAQQPLLSLAKRYNLPVEEAALHLSGCFRELGADIVLNTKIADDLALIEMRHEFANKYREIQSNSETGKNLPYKFPMLSSTCPGFICYAEKTHGSFILPHISTTRSAQQIMGVLVKQFLAKQLGVSSERIYHITLMPCFDKKLEALRADFYQELTDSHDVDFVITSLEIEQMLDNANKTLQDFPTQNYSFPWHSETDNLKDMPLERHEILWGHETSTSGGFAEHVFKYAAKELFNIKQQNLEFKQLRNPDFKEISLSLDGKVVLSFAIVNGFRNIQNLLQKFKRGKLQYHFVEIMACPSGCINGGGQIRPPAGQHQRELINSLEQLYKSLPQSEPYNELTQHFYEKFFEFPGSEKSEVLLHTKYHAVEKMETSLNIKW